MEEMKDKILRSWLRIELYKTAFKMGLINTTCDIEEKIIIDAVRCLDYESLISKEPSINYIITLIGLMWENIDRTKYDIRKIIIKFLSRIGYPTSAIICDENFNHGKGKFTVLDSWIDEVTSTVYQMGNEVTIASKIYLLTAFQKQIWDSMECNKILGISAPTSAGKSYVILIKICERLLYENIDVVYIVPTLSLQLQVMNDFNKELKNLNADNYQIYNTFEEKPCFEKNNIYVVTQEKAISAFSDLDIEFSKKIILVVDEIQNIERIEDATSERARILFDILIEFRYEEKVDLIVISGPYIENICKVGEKIFGKITREHITDVSPVVNLTYSIVKKGNKGYFLKQYCALLNSPEEIEIENKELIEGYGQKQYSDKYMSYLKELVSHTGVEEQNIIFAPTSNTARKIALSIDGRKDPAVNELIEYYSNTVRENYSLCETLKKGVAYHHGKLPHHVRRTLECAISEKLISTVVCTTTLLQGINLPAQNIFIRNPHLYIKKSEGVAELTNYELANLRGRVGRLLKDYIGRTFVLDENEFLTVDGYSDGELIQIASKELPTSYAHCFEQYRQVIEDVLQTNIAVDSTMRKYGHIVSYIRQSVLRYGRSSQDKMHNVGIELTRDQVAAILYKLERISVPKKICYQNRYWDPMVLDSIFKTFDDRVPNNPLEHGAKNMLDQILRYLRESDATSDMYYKYIPQRFARGKARSLMVELGIKWAKGICLHDILDSEWYDGEEGVEHIDDTIELLQQTVSYKLPLLLKPIYDMKKPDSVFLKCFQSGAFYKIPRHMIEMGIPRETALWLYKDIFEEVNIQSQIGMEVECFIREKIKMKYKTLPYWIRVQLDFCI